MSFCGGWWLWWGGVQNYLCVQPHYSVEVVLCCVVIGVVTKREMKGRNRCPLYIVVSQLPEQLQIATLTLLSKLRKDIYLRPSMENSIVELQVLGQGLGVDFTFVW